MYYSGTLQGTQDIKLNVVEDPAASDLSEKMPSDLLAGDFHPLENCSRERVHLGGARIRSNSCTRMKFTPFSVGTCKPLEKPLVLHGARGHMDKSDCFPLPDRSREETRKRQSFCSQH